MAEGRGQRMLAAGFSTAVLSCLSRNLTVDLFLPEGRDRVPPSFLFCGRWFDLADVAPAHLRCSSNQPSWRRVWSSCKYSLHT